MKHAIFLVALAVCAMFFTSSRVFAQGTALTYQGRLNDGANPANGTYDFRFRVASDAFGNNYVSGTLLTNGVPVAGGLFTVALDFGPGVFTGSNLWLEVSVRTNGAGGYTTLNPLQQFTASPYAIMAGSASNLAGALPASQLTGALPSNLLSGTYSGAVTFSNGASSFNGTFNGNGIALSNVNAAALGGLASSNFWRLGGNNVGAGQFLGSTNNQPLEIFANGQRALRLEPNSSGAPNVIGGTVLNFVANGVYGATIGGGGATNDFGNVTSNSVTGSFGTVAGGEQNTAAGYGTVAGGDFNSAGFASTVGGGGFNNASGFAATIAGGQPNMSTGSYSTVGGGTGNQAQGDNSTIPGGNNNLASGTSSFAAGNQAHAVHDGTFVWADSSSFSSFNSTSSNQFLIQATGGVGIGSAAPKTRLDVVNTSGDAPIRFGNSANDSGGFLVSTLGSQAILAGGVRFNGTNWVAKNSTASLVDDEQGTVRFFTDTGLTPGATFTPTERMRIATNGNVGIGTNSPAAALDVHGDIKLGSAGELFATGGVEDVRVVRGRIVGGTGNIPEGSGFSATRNGIGSYTITFSNAFTKPPSITISPFSTGALRFATVDSFNSGFVNVKTWNTNGTALDVDFFFVAAGPR